MAMADPALESLLWGLLGGAVLPAWLLAGLADYLAHARTRIEATTGPREAVLHLLQTTQIGVPMLGVLLLEVNALVLVLAVAGVMAHTATAYIDIRYTAPRRRIPAGEQFVHGFLIVLPFVALALILVLHWNAFASIGAGGSDWWPRWKRAPFPVGVIATVLVASLLLGVLPGMLELVRTLRNRPVATPAPAGRANEKAQR